MNLTVILCICLFFAGYEPFYLNYLVVQTTAYFSGKKKSHCVSLVGGWEWVSGLNERVSMAGLVFGASWALAPVGHSPCWTFLPLPLIQMLVGSGVRNWPLKGGVLCRVLCGSWAPGALESYQGARCLWFSRTLTLWPWAPHLGPTSFSCLDERTDVWSQVFGTPGGCGWRGCPVSISVCLWPWVWGQAPTLIKYICDKDTYIDSHSLSLFLSHSHSHYKNIADLRMCVFSSFWVPGADCLLRPSCMRNYI